MRNRKGFSLIEIMIVLVVIAVLTATSMFVSQNGFDQSREVVIKQNMEAVYTAANVYYADKGSVPADCATLSTNGYLQSCPTGPDSGASYAVSMLANGNIEITYTGNYKGASVTKKLSEMQKVGS